MTSSLASDLIILAGALGLVGLGLWALELASIGLERLASWRRAMRRIMGE